MLRCPDKTALTTPRDTPLSEHTAAAAHSTACQAPLPPCLNPPFPPLPPSQKPHQALPANPNPPEPQLLCQLRPQLLQQCVQPFNVNPRGQLTHRQPPVKQGVKVGSRRRLLVTLLGNAALAVVLCWLLLVGVGVGCVCIGWGRGAGCVKVGVSEYVCGGGGKGGGAGGVIGSVIGRQTGAGACEWCVVLEQRPRHSAAAHWPS